MRGKIHNLKKSTLLYCKNWNFIMKNGIREKSSEKVWADFTKNKFVTEQNLLKFQQYEQLITFWSQKFNLISFQTVSELVGRHFEDSLAVANFIDLTKVKFITDVGCGAGFPGIPLKIIFPHLKLLLIESNNKKQKFLENVINTLELEDVEIYPLDWRTFLRKTESDIEYFLSRASLNVEELSRMFKPGCGYKNTKLIYWASETWEPSKREEKFIHSKFDYKIKRRNAKLILATESGSK
jgi:16S rRNA (guanine(527)-N(7))-methyltransferase RsmG